MFPGYQVSSDRDPRHGAEIAKVTKVPNQLPHTHVEFFAKCAYKVVQITFSDPAQDFARQQRKENMCPNRSKRSSSHPRPHQSFVKHITKADHLKLKAKYVPTVALVKHPP